MTAGAPGRIVSLVPNLSEVLWWWHLADRVVGVTDRCVAPPRAFEHARRVGDTSALDVAAVVDLQPDLVVASDEENPRSDLDRLREAGMTVHVAVVHTVGDAGTALLELAEELGMASAGRELQRSIANAVEQMKPPDRRLTTACPIRREAPEEGGDDETWWLAGRGTYIGDLLGVCGFDVLPTDPDGRYPGAPLSGIALDDPDVVLLPDQPFGFGAEDAGVFADWRARVRLIDGTSLSWWGPRTPTALGDLSRLGRQLASSRRRRRSP